MSDNFFSRWARRKQGLETCEATLPEPVASVAPASAASPSVLRPDGQPPHPAQARTANAEVPVPADAAQPALPTMADVQGLTPSSDFQTFMRQGVPGEVRNAAMKKLFTDPHFNVMDGLDIYIGDYNTPDPMPAGMLQKMVGAQLLGLFDKPDEAAAKTTATAEPVLPAVSPAADPGGNPEQSPAAQQGSPVVAQSPASLPDLAGPASPVLQPHVKAHSEHDHPDLQLQPNHAPASPSPGPSTG
jgi:hypothetical protein